MDDLNKPSAEEAADQVHNESPYNENPGETSDAAMSLGDLSDVDTEVDDSLSMLSPSLLAPLLQTEHEEEEAGPIPNTVELEAQSSSTDPFASLFDGLVIAEQEKGKTSREKEEEEQEEKPMALAENNAKEVVVEPRIAPFSAKYTESMLETKPTVEEHQEDIGVEVQEALALPEPPPLLPQPPLPSLLQQQYQQQKNKVHYPDIPGASLLELAERAESRLAFGASATTLPDIATAAAPPVFSSSLESPFVSSADDGHEGGNSQLLFENMDAEEDVQAFRKQLLVASLISQLETSSSKTTELASAESSSSSGGGQNTTSMGTNLAARAFLSPQLEPIFKRGSGGGGGAVANNNDIPSVITKYLGIVAVGTSTGVVNILMPKALGKGPPQLHSLEDKSTPGDAVTAVALGQHAGGLLLLAGHASGQLRLWETKPVSGGTGSGGRGSRHPSSSSSSSSSGNSNDAGMTWVLARTVSGVHASALTACTVIDGGATTWALSADAHGRLMCHSVNRLLSITAQAFAGFARQWAGGGAAAASASALVSLEAAGQDPGIILSLAPLGSSSASIPTAQSTVQHHQHHHQQQAKTLYMTAEGNQFILLVATRAIFLAALSPEGSLNILHIFFPPPSLQGEDTGYAAWRLEVDSHQDSCQMTSSGAQHATHAVVAIAWGSSITIYRCALTRVTNVSPQSSPSKGSAAAVAAAAGGGGRNPSSPHRPAPKPLAPPQLLSNFSSEHPVNGLAFLGPLGALVVASADGEVATEITMYHPSAFFVTPKEEESVDESSDRDGIAAGDTMEKLNISDWMVVRQLDIPGAASLHGSLAVSSGGGGAAAGGAGGIDQLLILTSRGVRVIHLLTWHQRLSTLVSMHKLEVAMLSAVRLYLQATTPSAGSPRVASCHWPADGAAPSDAEEIARQLLTILHALIDSTRSTLISQYHQKKENNKLSNDNNEDNNNVENAAEQLADIAVNTCVLLSRSDALFDEIAPKFLSSPFSSAFLCQLEPRILADELPSLAPEVMQALVEHFAHSGQLERIEKCVLKLNILSLDLNQLIPLCLRHGLYGALIHIFIGALQDYQTPATLLMIAAANAAAQETKVKEINEEKNQSQLSSAIPPTSNILKSNKDRLENSLALQLGYRLLVYLRGCLCGLQYPPGSGHAPPQQQQEMRLHAVTFLLHVNTATLLDTWQLWASVAHLDNESNGNGDGAGSGIASSSLHDPSPVLRYLCQMDAPAVLGVLRDGLKGWDALESDLVDLSPELGPLILSNSSSSTTANAGGRTITQAAVDAVVHLLHENEQEPALLKFVAEHLAAQRASAEDAVLLRVLRFLADKEREEDENTVGGGDPGTQKGAQLSLAARESIFKDIVVHTHSSGQNNMRDNPQVRGEALDLARKAGFHQAEARIRHAERAFSPSFTCLVEDGARYPLAPFQYLRDICFDPVLTESDRNLVKSTALKLAPELVRIDARETAAVVAECFSPESHVAVLEVLAPWPDDQFAFLQAAIEGSSSSDGGGGGGGIKSSGNDNQRPRSGLATSTRPMSPESTLESFRGDPLFAPLLNNKGVSSLYVRLLCRFQPNDVLPFLQAHDTYNVDECLKHCIDHGAREAAAFLLERKGDVQAALKMYLEQVDVANTALVVVVKEQGIERIPRYYYTAASTSAPKMKMAAVLASSSSPSPSLVPPTSLLQEFISARDAMNSAVSMCIRFAQDRMTPVNSPGHLLEEKLLQQQGEDIKMGLDTKSGAGSTPKSAAVEEEEEEDTNNLVDFQRDPVLAVWFQVLQRYVNSIRKLRAEEKESILIPGNEILVDRLTCLERIFTAFMEEVISQMAGHVPLHSIAAAVLHKYSGDSCGDFRATLSSLLSACNFEVAILRCASRVTGTDTIALLKQGYKQCMMPQSVVTQEEAIDILENNSTGARLSGSDSQRSMLKSLESAQQIGQDAWAKAAAVAGPAASKLMEKAGFASEK